MNMKEELTKLYNTMLTIETKGTNTVVMGDCLKFLNQLIALTPENNPAKPEEKDIVEE